MKMKEFNRPIQRIDYRHYVEYNGEKYIREEVLSLECFCWESEPDKILDLHTIRWRLSNEEHYQKHGLIEYYSGDIGWSKDGKLDISHPVPEIEKVFKENIGKDLLYFKQKQ